MGSEKLDKLIDSTESLLNNLLHHVHKCDHECCVKDVLSGIYGDNNNACADQSAHNVRLQNEPKQSKQRSSVDR